MPAKFEHDHPGQNKPRAHSEIHHENCMVDLNTTPEEVLADLKSGGARTGSPD